MYSKFNSLLLALATFFLFSCQEDKTTDVEQDKKVSSEENKIDNSKTDSIQPPTIVGLWVLVDIDFGREIQADQQSLFDAMKKALIGSMSFEFITDGTCVATNVNIRTKEKESKKGTYTLSEDKKIVTIQLEGKETETTTIESLTHEEIVISTEDAGSKVMMTLKKY